MVSAIENNKDCEIEFVLLYSNLSDVSIKKYKSVEEKFNCKLRFIEILFRLGLGLKFLIYAQIWIGYCILIVIL